MAAAMDRSENKIPFVPWWLVLIEGLALIAIGVMLLVSPAATTAVLVQLLGIYWLIKGVINIIAIFFDHRMWGWKLFVGIISILAGLLIFNFPIMATLGLAAAITILMGILAIVVGTGNLVEAFSGAGWGTGILGILAILIGFLLLFNPAIGALSLLFVIGLLAIIGGVLVVIGAFALRSLVKALKQDAIRRRTPPVPAVARTGSIAEPLAAGSVEGVSITEIELPLVVAESETGPVVETVQDSMSAMETTQGETVATTVESSAVGDIATGAVLAAELKQVAFVETAEGDAVAVITETSAAIVETPTGELGEEIEPTEADVLITPEGDLVKSVAGAAVIGELEAAQIEIPNFAEIPEDQARFLKQDIEYVEGIGPVYGAKLKAVGIHSPLDLLGKGATRKGRELIVEATGIAAKLVLKWVNHADLFRLKGIGSEYADLLEAAGVDTVVELAQRNASNLFNKLVEINEEKKLVRLFPSQTQVEGWIEQAKQLGRIITY